MGETVPPEETHPRIGDFEGAAATYTDPDGEAHPATIRAVYRPAPERANVARVVPDRGDGETVDVDRDSDAFEVML